MGIASIFLSATRDLFQLIDLQMIHRMDPTLRFASFHPTVLDRMMSNLLGVGVDLQLPIRPAQRNSGWSSTTSLPPKFHPKLTPKLGLRNPLQNSFKIHEKKLEIFNNTVTRNELTNPQGCLMATSRRSRLVGSDLQLAKKTSKLTSPRLGSWVVQHQREPGPVAGCQHTI